MGDCSFPESELVLVQDSVQDEKAICSDGPCCQNAGLKMQNRLLAGSSCHAEVQKPVNTSASDISATSIVQRNLINEREKLKETDEFKQAVEEEWAARKLQIKVQAEEAQRLRQIKKAESFGVSDMLKPQRDIITERERLKETDEFKRAVKEEWAARQLQVKIQAEEAQKLRNRKKAETSRNLDMLKRLKQRLEEVRETQRKVQIKTDLGSDYERTNVQNEDASLGRRSNPVDKDEMLTAETFPSATLSDGPSCQNIGLKMKDTLFSGSSCHAEGQKPVNSSFSNVPTRDVGNPLYAINDREKLKETDEFKQAVEEEWKAKQAEEAWRLRQIKGEESSRVSDIITEREMLKETDEFKRAFEEEWAARQLQLKVQAEESQRLRKRRKAETSRNLDMQKRKKQRLEEVRETQRKDEENLNLKENFCVEVRKELYQLENTCIDMASLLNGLGIHVGSGYPPTPQEVNAAYKRALLKFHPDRASRTDIRQQVEAEEKFKLISRMKEKFFSAPCG
ncbi:uncharacterized protein LOC126654020 isoform X2 [Mercurialis annua]|uniref:uncharacterized protein LOC126654020 isoform X2 n=1 Tax=Mercurialis annua TaxID=3986 RepID=UPI00215FB8D1|nr:uncharacterized protein LOC126654020 isoform X2 [Mercurialis annua]